MSIKNLFRAKVANFVNARATIEDKFAASLLNLSDTITKHGNVLSHLYQLQSLYKKSGQDTAAVNTKIKQVEAKIKQLDHAYKRANAKKAEMLNRLYIAQETYNISKTLVKDKYSGLDYTVGDDTSSIINDCENEISRLESMSKANDVIIGL